MLRSLRDLLAFKIKTPDGWTGAVRDFFIDEEGWNVRRLEVEAGFGMGGIKTLLLEPGFTRAPDSGGEVLPPPADGPFLPVSLSREEIEHVHGEGVLAQHGEGGDGGPCVHRFMDLMGYDVAFRKDRACKLIDLIVDTAAWRVHWMVIDLGKIWPDRKIMVPPHRIRGVDSKEQEIRLDLSKRQVRRAPDFNPTEPVNRKLELKLYDYYGRPKAGPGAV